jgi:hypothetical protein
MNTFVISGDCCIDIVARHRIPDIYCSVSICSYSHFIFVTRLIQIF